MEIGRDLLASDANRLPFSGRLVNQVDPSEMARGTPNTNPVRSIQEQVANPSPSSPLRAADATGSLSGEFPKTIKRGRHVFW